MTGFSFYEFFAGGGLVRTGLGPHWRCAFANDVCPKKAGAYALNHPMDAFRLGDVADVRAGHLPGRADLAWASFPCQDLSLAGAGAGLGASRSGAFWPFHRLIRALKAEGRAPTLVVLENVVGALSRRGGADFAALCSALAALDYRVGALVIDAAAFVPQSRPRVFIVAACAFAAARAEALGLAGAAPHADDPWRTPALDAARAAAPLPMIFWRLDPPRVRRGRLVDLVEAAPNDVALDPPAMTAALLGLMTQRNRAKTAVAQAAARASGVREVGALYRRTRIEGGVRVQRAEARFDGLAGCLRTPAGGSSRQRLVIAEPHETRTRLLSAREAARLMGAPDGFQLPARYSEAYKLMGDGVAIPVVRHLARGLIEPLLSAAREGVAA